MRSNDNNNNKSPNRASPTALLSPRSSLKTSPRSSARSSLRSSPISSPRSAAAALPARAPRPASLTARQVEQRIKQLELGFDLRDFHTLETLAPNVASRLARRAPNPANAQYSKRAFDGLIRIWKEHIHDEALKERVRRGLPPNLNSRHYFPPL